MIRTSALPFPRATRQRLPVALALLAILAGCGVGETLRRGDRALTEGNYDAAIGAYDDAARRAGLTTVDGRLAEERGREARRRAAHDAVRRGDIAFEANSLSVAADHYRRARAYAPADPKVVAALSRLLALRTEIENGMRELERVLTGLEGAGDGSDLTAYRAAAGRARTLRAWRRDYPQTEALWDRARRGLARRLIGEARAAAPTAGAAAAATLADEALRWDADVQGGVELRDQLRAAGDADSLVATGQAALEAGQLDRALRAFGEALTQNPNHEAALRGRSEARASWVKVHLDAAKAAEKARKRRDALLLLRQAAEVGTDDAKLWAALDKAHARAHAAAVGAFEKSARKLQARKLFGAALIAWRTAAALGGTSKAIGKGLESSVRTIEAARTYAVAVQTPAVPKPVRGTLTTALQNAIASRLADTALGEAGVRVVAGREARSADGTLQVDVARWELVRLQRREERRKKILDHVEFPANPAWQAAQDEQAAALTALNLATDQLRPLQQKADDAETRLAEVDRKLAEIRARIDAENAEHYRGKPAPCPDGSTRCAESYGAKRWQKQLDYYVGKSRQISDELRQLAPALDAARARVQEGQRRFDAAERKARETPAKLREEIWKDYPYEVVVHELRIDVDLSIGWKDRVSGQELAHGEFRLEDVRVDYETPEISAKGQLVEAARQSALPDDATLQAELFGRALDAVAAKVWPPLAAHGQRFVRRAESARKPDEQLHWWVLALSVGRGLDDTTRARIEQQVYEATGYDWQRIAVDLSRIPY